MSSNNGLYIYNGSGWYKVALVNATPYWDTEASASYTFTIDTAITITLLAGDSDGHSIEYTATPDSDANLFITISKDSDNGRIFTLTPDSENEAPGTSNSGTITFKASDGISFASTVSTFTLNFSNIIADSAETVFLMKAAGNSATNAAITYQNSSDVSTGFTETSAPQASTFSPYRSGGYSTKFADGVGGNLNWSGTYLDSDYTIEAWIYTTEVDNSGYNNIISDQSSNVQLTLHNGGNGNMMTVYQSAVKLGATSSSTGLNEWAHFVWEREGTTIRHYANGALLGSGTADSNAFTISKIGQYYTGGYEHHGYIRDLRVLKSAKYGGSSYTIPTSSPAFSDDATTQFIACHLPYIAAEGVSISRTGATFTSTAPFGPYDYEPWTADSVGGSVYFDGTDDRLTAAASTDFGFDGDFTVESWIYYTGGNGYVFFWVNTSGSGDYLGYGLNTGTLNPWLWNGANVLTTSTDVIPNTWQHHAVVRNGTTLTIYLDGKSIGSTTDSTTFGAGSQPFYIGWNGGNDTQNTTGYISDLKVVKGTAVYTSNFTPPTAPLSHGGSTTKMLMNNKSDANIYDASASMKLNLVNDAKSSTTQRKFSTSSSLILDGTDIVYIDPSDLNTAEFLSGPWTIEFWLYPTNWYNNGGVFTMGWQSGNYGPFVVYTGTGTNWLIYASNNGSSWNLGAAWDTYIARWTNSWKHVAMTWDTDGSFTMWLDGSVARAGTGLTNLKDNSIVSTSRFAIGGGQDGANYGFPGYVQDLRLSRKIRYTGTFTPPTAEFEL